MGQTAVDLNPHHIGIYSALYVFYMALCSELFCNFFSLPLYVIITIVANTMVKLRHSRL